MKPSFSRPTGSQQTSAALAVSLVLAAMLFGAALIVAASEVRRGLEANGHRAQLMTELEAIKAMEAFKKGAKAEELRKELER